MGLFERLRASWRDIGAPLGVGPWLVFVVSYLFQLQKVWDLRLDVCRIVVQPLVETATKPRGFAVDEAVSGDPRADVSQRPQAVLAQRWREGARCFLISTKETPIGCAWFSIGQYTDDVFPYAFSLNPAHRMVWDFDVFIVPEYRLGRAFQQLWQLASAQLRSEGYTHTASRIAATNVRSLLAHAKLGAVTIRSIYQLTFGRRALVVLTRPFKLHWTRTIDRIPIRLDLDV